MSDPRNTGSRWGWVANLVLALASVSVSLALGELLFRALPAWSGEKAPGEGKAYRFNPFRPDPYLPFALREGARAVHQTEHFEVGVSINESGLRGPSIPATRPPGRYRVLVLGDSFAFGWGVEEADSFGARLAQGLRVGTDRVEVLNGGVPGWSADDQLIFLERRGLDLSPDLVLMVETENDPDDLQWKELELDEGALPVRARSTHRIVDHRGRLRTVRGVPAVDFPGEEWLRSHSYLWNAVRFRLTKLHLRFLESTSPTLDPDEEERLLGRPLARLTPSELQRGLRSSPRFRLAYHRMLRGAIEARSRSRGISVRRLLVTFSDRSSFDPQVLEGLHRDCAASEGICLDTRDFFEDREQAEAFYPGDGHWTPFGHRRVAERLSAWLERTLPSAAAAPIDREDEAPDPQ